MTTIINKINRFQSNKKITASLLICCGGFEDRTISFVKKLKKNSATLDHIVLLRYSQKDPGNEKNYNILKKKLKQLSTRNPVPIEVDSTKAQKTFQAIKLGIENLSIKVDKSTAIIDITGMTHLIAISSIHICMSLGFIVQIIYSEAIQYYPLISESKKLIRTWSEHNYQKADKFLQSGALKTVDILQEFQGNIRPGRKLCLFLFAGYEPNRIEGLVNIYNPGAIIVLYGKSPHKKFLWRVKLSKELHKDLFGGWLVHETTTSTINILEIQDSLEKLYGIVKNRFDVAITPHCSKMQGVAAYLFWRNHPETQLVFTSPVSFHPLRYSKGCGRTFTFNIV